VVEAFLRLPESMRAMLVLLGEGPTRPVIAEQLAGKRALLPGYVHDRSDLARWLASADLYASGMANETFGISVIEAQASGLPVVGVAGGAMVDRVTPEIGRIGPVDDAQAMADHLVQLWSGDHRAMKRAACRHAQQFSWQQSMDSLFGTLYPRALHRAAARRANGLVGAPRKLVRAR
jgi:alpha-1,6-mannosyltransferase